MHWRKYLFVLVVQFEKTEPMSILFFVAVSSTFLDKNQEGLSEYHNVTFEVDCPTEF